MNIENIKDYRKRNNMNYQIKKITIIIFTTLFLNACVTGGKDVISSAKEKVFNSKNYHTMYELSHSVRQYDTSKTNHTLTYR